MSMHQFPRMFSMDSTKAIKAQDYGWLNAINYMAPADTAGIGNLCPHASAGCKALCLGEHSGQAAMISRDTGTNEVRESRKRKAVYFMRNRPAYMAETARHIALAYRQAQRKRMHLAVRMNGSTDIAYESVRFMVDDTLAAYVAKVTGKDTKAGAHTVFTLFPYIQFVDYTKNPKRFARALPQNYDLTFSRSETNDADAIELLSKGVNVAVVFANTLPDNWHGFPVIDGDKHDLRHLDAKGGRVVGLLPKGSKAKRDQSGFVVR